MSKQGAKVEAVASNKVTFSTENEWLEARRSSIGGSDAPVIAGVSPYVSPLQLYYDKAGLLDIEMGDPEPRDWGKRLEPLVAQVYGEQTGRNLVDHGLNMFRGGFDFPSHASLDREIVDADRGPGVLQVKTTAKYSLKELQEDLPLDWQVQIQHEMANSGFAWGSFAILMVLSRKLGYIDVERNDAFIETLLESERAFWARVLSHEPPDADGSDSTSAVLKALYPKDSGAAIALPVEALGWDTELQKVKDICKQAETAKTELENKIKAAIGEATFGVLPDGTSYSWRLQQRAGFVVKPTEFRVLRRKESR